MNTATRADASSKRSNTMPVETLFVAPQRRAASTADIAVGSSERPSDKRRRSKARGDVSS
jgi:hypothetical protein